MKRCVIVGGGTILDYERMKKYLSKDDYYIFCDCGLRHEQGLSAAPDLVIGDFDSYVKPNRDVEIITLPAEKDDTDTVYAAKEALRRGFQDFLLIGMTGGRMDHTLVNIYLLLLLHNAGAQAILADDCGDMRIFTGKVSVSQRCKYFSLLTLCGPAAGVTIENAKYTLDNGRINSDYQFATSNEVLPGKIAKITYKSGILLLIQIYTE